MKTPFVTKAQIEEIVKTYPTPFHIYDEKGIRENARKLKQAFAWNKGYKEYFAVKATPNPTILKILKEEGCGTDCSSYTELLMSEKMGITGSDIMFSSNDTPAEEFVLAKKLGANINLDDYTHVQFLKDTCGVPETVFCRYNPGGTFSISTTIMDNPGDAKYGMTKEQLFKAYTELRDAGAKKFGLHSFLASNTVTNDYYPTLAKILFEVAVELKEKTGIELAGEQAGVVAGPEYTASVGGTWYEGSVLSAAIGQENNRFTPLQLAHMVATLVGGGDRWQVHLLQKVAGEAPREKVRLGKVNLSPGNVAAIKEGMLAVTQSGSLAAAFQSLPVQVGAKTGSAQVDGEETSNAVLVCFAPYEDPEIALAVVVEQGGSGSSLGTVAAQVIQAYVQ